MCEYISPKIEQIDVKTERGFADSFFEPDFDIGFEFEDGIGSLEDLPIIDWI